MKAFATDLRSAALVSLILVLPFVILESVNTTLTRQNAPGFVALFGFLWLLPTAFLAVLISMVRSVRAGNAIAAHPVKLLCGLAFVVVLALMWGNLLVDQM